MTTSGAKAASRITSSRLTSKSSSTGVPRRRRATKGSVPKPPETPGSARIIAIANQKGGVGKSTTAVSLGAALAELGYRVLVVDLDPQGNASTGMGIRHAARATTVYHVIVAESPIDDAIVPTPVEHLHAVPSTIDLAGAEIELVSRFSRETRLKKALDPIREGRYDFVLLDCPPSLGLLTVNALTAAEELIVPIQCEYYALEGLGQLLRNVSLVQQNINPELRLSGIVMTMFDPRTKLSEQVVAEVQRFFGEVMYDVIIPRTVRLSEAPGYGQPITVYDPRSKGAQTYRQLAAEVACRPRPDEPMPIFDDLPAMVIPTVDDTIKQEARAGAELEDLPTPTVHELLKEAAPAPAAEPPPDPEPVLEPEPAPPPEPVPPLPMAEVDEDDLWEDPDEPVSSSLPPRRATPHYAPPEHLPERRVVVIDEDAELGAPSKPAPSQGSPVRTRVMPSSDAEIGATLEEEGVPKRRWRLFRKGGE